MNIASAIEAREIRHFHLFCGLGGGAKGFNRATARVGNMVGAFRCIGGVDVDRAAIRDFSRAAGVPGTVIDLFDRSQYVAFHGREPGIDWREATTADIHAAAGGERPHIVFLSAPCKGFSGLLSETKSGTDKYQALNRLTLRGVWLMLEAFADDPPELVVFENVPRIANRGRPLLDKIGALLRHYGYAVAETTHDCGELGGLAQSRKRFLLVARHIAKVPPFLYEPPKRALRGVGTVLERLPLPGDPRGGAMHRVPSLQWQTWVRLAFVEAGGDWRSLNKLAIEDGKLRDFLIVPAMRDGVLGVRRWDEPSGTVAGKSGPTNGAFSVADPRKELRSGGYGVAGWDDSMGTVAGESLPSNGAFSVADPRFDAKGEYGQLGVRGWGDSMGTIRAVKSPIQGGYSVADPRMDGDTAPDRHKNVFRVVRWDREAGTISGGHGPSSGGQCVADPRPHNNRQFENIYRVTAWDRTARTVIGATAPADGAMSVADPRCAMNDRKAGDDYLTGGHYGVVPWQGHTGAISAAGQHDNGRWSVADPRLPETTDRLACVIEALDGTWHRPFTTLELAALQSLVDPEEALELEGLSDQAWRERIGNAVPPDAAQAIAETMGTTLLLAWSGETFMLSAAPIWVRNVAVALSVQPGEVA